MARARPLTQCSVLFYLSAMRHCSTLPFVLLGVVLAGCGASASSANLVAAQSEAQAARAEAMREHDQLLEVKARLLELERRSANQTRPCEATPDPRAVDVAPARERPKTEPLRSQGDFLAEARVVAPGPLPPATPVAVRTSPQLATLGSDRGRVEQLLNELREYGFDLQSGLSLERREALRVLLRRERQLDLMNPWDGH